MSSNEASLPPEHHEDVSDAFPLPNLSELYPAECEYWRGMEIVSVWEFVLLSLGIEPRTIRILIEQCNPDEEDRTCYGMQEQEYNRRIAAIRNAIAAGSLIPAQTLNPQYANHFRLSEIIAWARSKALSLPEWLKELAPPQNATREHRPLSSIRERKKAETQAAYQKWQSRADDLHREHPSWSKSEIARKIERELENEASPPCANTIRNNIEILP